MKTGVQVQTVNQLAREARSGQLSLPRYQRELVWDADQALRLVQSVSEGFPIGALLAWKTRGGEELLLDGQQRVSTLTGWRPGRGPVPHPVGWSLEAGRWALEPVSETDTLATLSEWLGTSGNARFQLQAGWRERHGEAAWEACIRAIDAVQYAVVPVLTLERATPAQAVEAFRRLNAEGTPFDLEELERLLSLEEKS